MLKFFYIPQASIKKNNKLIYLERKCTLSVKGAHKSVSILQEGHFIITIRKLPDHGNEKIILRMLSQERYKINRKTLDF